MKRIVTGVLPPALEKRSASHLSQFFFRQGDAPEFPMGGELRVAQRGASLLLIVRFKGKVHCELTIEIVSHI